MKCEFNGCKRYAWEGDNEGFCIFHSSQIEEKEEEFQKAWKLFLDKRRGDDGSYRRLNCVGFVFPGPISMSKSTLSEGANFKEARFSGDTRFDGVLFQGHAYFSDTRFEGSTRFEGARFDKIADFGGSRFERIATFEGVRFDLSADFQRTQFREGGNFRESSFQGEADFQDTLFANGIDFVEATFSKRVDFRNAEGGPIEFEKAILDGADLRDCSLSNLRLTHITRYRGAKFGPTDVDRVDWTGSDRLRKKVLHQNDLFDFRSRNRFNRFVLYPLWKVTSNCSRSPALWIGWSVLIALMVGVLYIS